ncbi:Formamidopyrimidine-DNA glycosylase [Nostoc sp. DSM 114161]|jgi:formamidopyrimidine-DNA glycosylase|uniref:DNA-formamidopyrimidine glycosylase n=1 Tax=Nostoc sp. DSM 114161 TaxID=3440143 RepID=UPI0040465BA6
MPELPEVETVRRGLNQLTLNQKITGGDVLLDRTIAYPFSVGEFIDGIKNSAIAIWHRRGKYLLAELTSSSPSSTSWLGVHLRMTGQLLWVDRDEPLHKHTRVRLFFGDRQELRFVDQRTFGQMWWVPPGVPVESVITGLAKLAADPFSDEFSVEYLASKLQKRRRPIKTALLDQSVVAGLGNIYADEALFKSGILPETLCTDLQLKQIENLRTAIIQVLETSIEAGGTTFSNFLNVKGVNGNYGGVAWVYNRAGEPCRVCDTPIMRTRLAGRSSHFCPECQRG